MSEYPQRRATSTPGSAFFLFLLVLAALFGIVTAYAIRSNPLHSDRSAYGISKYAFIEQCKEQLHDADTLPLLLPGQSKTLGEALKEAGQLQPGEHAAVRLSASSQAIVSGVQEVQMGENTKQLGLSAPATILLVKNGEERPLVPINMRCLYNQQLRKAEVQLVAGQ